MEKGPSLPSNFESSATDKPEESSTLKKDSKKDKKTNRYSLLEPAAEKTVRSNEEKPASVESLWRRLLGQTPPEVSTEKASEKIADTADAKTPIVAELNSVADEAPLEALSESEERTVMVDFIEGRQAELLAEQTEMADRPADEAQAAERAADLLLLATLHDMLARDSGESTELPIDDAYQRVAGEFVDGPTAPPPTETVSEAEPAGPTEPPTPPRPPHGGEPFWQHYDGGGPANTPVAVRETTPPPAAETSDYYQNRTGSALLVGGIIGYLIGRRHGRLKTEKQLAVVEKKLTAKVSEVQQKVYQKEQQIRQLAREAYTLQTVQRTTETVLRQERAQRPERAAALLSPRERLGSVTLKAAETVAVPKAEAKTAKPEKLLLKNGKTMSRQELLETSATIRVGATNLRRVYETNLISEQGLRRLVHEYESHGNVQKVLQEELVAKEKSYELDPRMRNRGAVGSLVARKLVGASFDKPDLPEVAGDKAVAAPVAASESATPLKPVPPHQQQRAAIAAAATLVIIIAVLLYLLFTSK